MGARSRGSQLPGNYAVQGRVLGIATGSTGSGVVFVNRTGATVKVKRISMVPEVAITGAATNNFAWGIVNKAAAGIGAVAVTTVKTFANGTNAAALVEDVAALSATAANLLVAAGDVLTLDKTINASGLAMPAVVVCVEYEFV